MRVKFLITMCFLLLVFRAEAQYTFPACSTPWAPGTYLQNALASHKGVNYQAKYYTTAEPGTNGDWQMLTKCGDGGLGPDYAGIQKVIGYLPYWVPNFSFTNFDPGTVTHINIAFNLFKQNNNDYNSADFASIAWGEFHNRKVDSILFDLGVLNRAKAKGTKVSVAIGGATDFAFRWLMEKYYNNDAKLEEIANFITNYVNAKGIDGVDLDLECWWPDAAIAGTTEQGGRVRGDKWGGVDAGPHPAGAGLAKLAQKLRQKMPNKILSAAVFGTSYYGNNYDDTIAQYLDYVGLMTYDFTGSWNTSPIGPHSSLYKVPLNTYQGQTLDAPIYSAEDALEYWMGMAPPAWNHDGGFNVAKAKLCIGVPFYGYDMANRKPNNANGFIAPKWNEIVAEFPNAATSYDPLDPRQLGGYVAGNGKKIYFETPKGAGEKIKYTKRFGHQGVIVWELTGDMPYSGGKSLLKAINDAKGGVIINPAPTVSITSPVNNATFTAPATVNITATATDNVSVSKVDFYNGSTLLGTDTSSPYSFSWPSVAAGSYPITVTATDNEGAIGTSTIINIVVNQVAGNVNPTTAITAPTNNATFTSGTTINVTATAADTDGTISKVDFYNGATLLGTDTSSPFSYSWPNVAAGSYALTTKATDNANGVGISSVVNIVVNTPGNVNPTASITSPTNNASFIAPATVSITATATDADGTINKVDFYNGSTLLGTDTSSPFSYAWSSVSAGSYSLTVKATDNAGGTGTSSIVNIVVNPAGNVNPTVSISSPSIGASFTAPASVTINATATDSDGTIAKVDFYNGSSLLGTDTSSPFSYTWANVAAGTYTITVKATDNGNGLGTSGVVTITVNTGGGDNCASIPQYVPSGGNYVAGSIVKNVGNQYECRPWPNSGWCSLASWAYAPGTGAYWTDAWILKASCSAGRGVQIETTPLQENQLDSHDLSFYPNPGVSNKEHDLTLIFDKDAGNVSVQVLTTSGTSVSGNNYTDVKRKLLVTIPSMKSGLYFIRVQGHNKAWVKKYFIK